MEPVLVRVECDPNSLELKRYDVMVDGQRVGYVVQKESQLTIPLKGTRLIRNGKRRPFWFSGTPTRGLTYRVKHETRAAAVNWIVR